MNGTHQPNAQALRSILGTSVPTVRLKEAITRCAPHDSTVLITGPTGTGKELVARSIHRCSHRSGALFIPVDCTSISGSLFASQLFGHRKGAFTGADYEAIGCFRAAHQGTIFLDEIGELESDLQAKLLRVLQERVVVPIGSHDPHPVDVRVVCATSRDLKREVVEGRFREDLFYRLNVVQLETPPLKDRIGDIPELVEHFLERLAVMAGFSRKRVSPGTLELFATFDWPGNVRQLRHFVEQAVIACEEEMITLPIAQRLLDKARMPAPRPTVPPAAEACCEQCQTRSAENSALSHAHGADQDAGVAADSDGCWVTLGELERQHICTTLEHTFYNQSAAARLLGITRSMLIRKMHSYGLHTPKH